MSHKPMDIGSIFTELKRRRVFRVAGVYAGAAFILTEGFQMLAGAFQLPEWTVTFVVSLLIIGFPVAVIMAWAFDVTPEGVVRTTVSSEKGTPARKPFTSNAIIAILVLIIIGMILYPNLFPDETSAAGQTEEISSKSVAVLPFTSLSDNKDDEYFSDGITDVILTQLSKIRDLKVISRTSTMQYKKTAKTVREIAAELGVASVLEGSVQRVGSRIRIVSQLIDTRNDEHLWAETYDRDYADIFAIQSDVARQIAHALRSTLSPEERQQLEKIPTDNLEAYDYFLKGNHYWYTKATKEGNLKAVEMYEKAIELDPEFALAYARASITHSVLYEATGWDHTEERKNLAKMTLDKALVLDPDHPEVHLARGTYYEWCLEDYDRALEDYELAFQGQPNSGEIAQRMGWLHFIKSHWEKAEYYLLKALELDPQGLNGPLYVAGLYWYQRDFGKAESYYKKAIASNPEQGHYYSFLAQFYLFGLGDIKQARKTLEEGEPYLDVVSAHFSTEILDRNYQAALRVAERYSWSGARFLMLGVANDFLGEGEAAHAALDSARVIFEDLAVQSPDNAYYKGQLGIIYARLGMDKQAIETGRKAIQIQPLSRNGLEGPFRLMEMAEIYIIVGEADLAIDLFEYLLSIPSPLSVGALKLDPRYDPLRNHPRFQKLIAANSRS